MRLITKTTLLILLLTLIVFGIGGIVTYRMVKKVVKQETDYSLYTNLRMLKESIAHGNPIEALQNRKVIIEEISESELIPEDKGTLTDTLVMHQPVKGLEPYRKLVITKTIEDKFYRFELMDVFIETHDMYEGVLNIMSRLFIGLSLVLLFYSLLISKWLFQPFQLLLQRIGNFNLSSNNVIDFPETSTTEFKELNSFIEEMTTKASKDYHALKEFSENASHEMQTPIAIALGKLELLMGSSSLSEEDLKLVEEAQVSLSRLSKLGKALSLLTKIENKEFSTQEVTNLSETVNSSVATFQEVAALKQIELKSEVKDDINIHIDTDLADIMVSNLLKNAIQHNEQSGWISVNLDEHQLKVINTGPAPKVDTNKLFERFRKSNQSSSSLGLGLAIIKKISQLNDFDVAYKFEDELHELIINFGKAKNQNSFKFATNSTQH